MQNFRKNVICLGKVLFFWNLNFLILINLIQTSNLFFKASVWPNPNFNFNPNTPVILILLICCWLISWILKKGSKKKGIVTCQFF